MPPNNNPVRAAERGNVFIFILLGLVLFAALSFTVSRGFRSDTTSQMTDRQAELTSSDLLDFAQQVERTVSRLRRNGCSENQISFQRDVNRDGNITDNSADHYNANAPADKTCHVYVAEGGGLTYRSVDNYNFVGSGDNAIDGVGCNGNATCTEMTLASRNIDPTLCAAINRKLGITGIPTDANGASGFGAFDGNFKDFGDVGDSDANLTGNETACYLDSDDNMHIFYSVLIVR